MKACILAYLFLWSFSAYGQGDQPSSEAFKQFLFEALDKRSTKLLYNISAHNGVVAADFFDQIDNVDLSNAREYCIQRFSAKSKQSGIQEFRVEVAFQKREINSRSHTWIIAGLRKLQNQSRNGEVMIPRLDPNSDLAKEQKGFLPLAHEFNFSDFSRAVEARNSEVIQYLREVGFDFLADYRLEPIKGTIYIISEVALSHSGGKSVSYNFIAQDLPVSDQKRESGWYLTNISPMGDIDTQLTANHRSAQDVERKGSQEDRKDGKASETSDGHSTSMVLVAFYHDADFMDFPPYQQPFLRVAIRGISDIEYDFDKRTEEIVIRCKNCDFDPSSEIQKKQTEFWEEQKKYFFIEIESQDNNTIIIVLPKFRVGAIKVFRNVDKKKRTKSSWLDILPLNTSPGGL